jgi:hypothetical protein
VKSSLRLIFGSLASGNQTSQWKIHHLYISMIFPFTLPINFGDFAKNHGWLLGYVSYVPISGDDPSGSSQDDPTTKL